MRKLLTPSPHLNKRRDRHGHLSGPGLPRLLVLLPSSSLWPSGSSQERSPTCLDRNPPQRAFNRRRRSRPNHNRLRRMRQPHRRQPLKRQRLSPSVLPPQNRRVRPSAARRTRRFPSASRQPVG